MYLDQKFLRSIIVKEQTQGWVIYYRPGPRNLAKNM